MKYLSISISVIAIVVIGLILYKSSSIPENFYWAAALLVASWQMVAFIQKKTVYAGATPIKFGEYKKARLFVFMFFVLIWIICIVKFVDKWFFSG